MMGEMRRVHITLKDVVGPDPEALNATMERIMSVTKIRGVNEKRFRRYGILSGDIDTDDIEKLKLLDIVQAVELDEIRRATTGPAASDPE